MPNIVNNTTFPGLFDLLTPHSCRGCGQIGNVLCERCKNHIKAHHQIICPCCKTPTKSGKCPNCPDLPPTYIIGERSGLLGSIVHDYKYNSIRALSKPLAELMCAFLPPTNKPTIIIPLPTIDRHIRARGFDHTKLIAKHLSKLKGRACKSEQILIRARNTTQVGTNRLTRIAQAANAYSLAHQAHIEPNTTYILLDDVWTTGASMRACTEILKKNGASDLIIALLALSNLN